MANDSRGDAPPKARAKPGGDEGTRSAVLQAALDSICDLGYYKASSNEIARRASVSWGVIQYYFGSRDALMLAVLQDGVERTLADLDAVAIEGKDVRTRLRQVWNIMSSFFGRAEYAAILQILWNLSRAPKTRDSSYDAIVRHTEGLGRKWNEVFLSAIGEERSVAVAGMAYDLMWGLATEDAAGLYMSRPDIDQARVARLPNEVRVEMLLDAIEGLLQHDRG